MVLSRLSSFDGSKLESLDRNIYMFHSYKSLYNYPLKVLASQTQTNIPTSCVLFIPSQTEVWPDSVLGRVDPAHLHPCPPPVPTAAPAYWNRAEVFPKATSLPPQGSGVSGCLMSTITQNKRGYRVQNNIRFYLAPHVQSRTKSFDCHTEAYKCVNLPQHNSFNKRTM